MALASWIGVAIGVPIFIYLVWKVLIPEWNRASRTHRGGGGSGNTGGGFFGGN